MQKKTWASCDKRIRVLVAKPGLDGHDRGALILCRALRDAGMEVIYTGFLATPEQVSQMAIDKHVHACAISPPTAAHITTSPKHPTLTHQNHRHNILLL